MAKQAQVSETPATQWLKQHKVPYSEHVYEYVERSILELPRILIHGGRRGYLVGLEPRVLTEVLRAQPVDCALGAS